MNKNILKIISVLFIINALTNTAQSEDNFLQKGALLITSTLKIMIDNKTMTYTQYGQIADTVGIMSEENRRFLSATCIIETKSKGKCVGTINTLIESSKLKHPDEYICNMRIYISESTNSDLRCHNY
jgi:hypothetical protein